MKQRIGLVLFIFICSCSSSPQLKRFDDKDISSELSQEIAKKFEVSEVAKPGAAPAVVKAPEVKKKVKGKKVADVEPTKSLLVPPSRRTSVMPFEVGEKLEYDIRALGLTAGTFNLEVQPPKMINGREAYPIVGVARTVKFFELIYRVNDRVESFFDFNGLYSHRFTMDLDESKQTRKVLELYDYDKKKSYYWSKMDHVDKGFSEKKEEHDIPLWAQDPVSMLYWLRIVDLPKGPGETSRYNVIVDGKPWECVLRFDRRENRNYLGKNMDTIVMRMDNYQDGQLKNKDHQIWIADSPKRYILRIEAKIRVGAVAAALEKATP